MIKIFFPIFYLCFFVSPISAQSFSSDDYQIQWGNFNMTAGRKSNTNYTLTDTVGQNTPGQYTRSGYLIKSGFQYIHDQIYAFSFKINHLEIDFGTLVAGIATSATDTITVTTPTGNGYQIFAAENHPLTQNTGVTIPDTNCNSGCSESSAGPWTTTSNFGFGLNVIGVNSSGVATGVGTSNYFPAENQYRQFANIFQLELPQVIMAHPLPARSHSAKITYKTIVSAVQSAGIYQNSIIYTAVPNY